jgi:single-strand DNA-binding protein
VVIATDAVAASRADTAARDGPVGLSGRDAEMNETMVTVVGNVATQPVYRETENGASVRFRVAATARYLDRERGEWRDGHTNFFTVWANRQLAANVAASVSVGEPVMVQGRLRVRTDSGPDGVNRSSADIDALAIGHDMSRGTSMFRREHRQGTPAHPGAPGGAGGMGGGRPEPNWETPVPDAGSVAADGVNAGAGVGATSGSGPRSGTGAGQRAAAAVPVS